MIAAYIYMERYNTIFHTNIEWDKWYNFKIIVNTWHALKQQHEQGEMYVQWTKSVTDINGF